jgi:carboxyl-terminal processing protease
MKKFIVIVTILVLLVINVNVFAADQEELNSVKYFEDVLKYVDETYKYEVSEADMYKAALNKILEENPELINNAVEGAFNILDKHSTYFYEEEMNNFELGVIGKFTGIGVVITVKDNYITVISPIEDSPALDVGIISGDKIIKVDGQDIEGIALDKAAMMLRGKEGTSVSITILRDEKELEFDLVRRIIKLNPIDSKIIEDNIGYIRIIDFNTNGKEFMQEVLNEYKENGIEKLIIDVRNNPGGALDVSFAMSSFFVPKGKTIVKIVDGNDNSTSLISNGNYDFNFEIVVLANEGSASAAEIFVGAMKDNNIAKIVGQKTFGKGSAQKLVPLKIGGGIKLTVSEFFTPNNSTINNVGIRPNFSVKNEMKKIDTSKLLPLEVVDKYEIGSESEYVKAAEERLSLLGYDVSEPDNYYDEKTFEAVKMFQEKENLYPYGVLDLTTQGVLKDRAASIEYVIDNQLIKAIDLLK